uniref:Uncharacterized protein n=1 Tax=Sphaerodactylus townsendi TaxID=933632 RepID=A0ACB8G8Y8_9SAUR
MRAGSELLCESLLFSTLDPKEGITSHPLAAKSPSKATTPHAPGYFSSADTQVFHSIHSENQREMNGKPTPLNAEEFNDGKRWSRFSGTSEDSGIEAASVGSPGPEEPLCSVGSKAHNYEPMNQAGSLEHDSSMGEGSLCQSKQQALGGESKFPVSTSPQEGPEQLPTRVASSSSCPAAPGDAVVDKDSPESPFEVIADKLEFDKEFKDALASNSSDISSNWVMHSERELLTDIPEDSVCEFRAKPRGGSRLPSGLGLSRQSSGTNAALEEVSKCVRELHNFTSEMMNWDLIPKDLGEKTADPASSGHPTSPTGEAGGVLAGSVGSKAEVGRTSAPFQPVKIKVHQNERISSEGAKPPSQKRVNGEAAAVKTAVVLNADVCWPNPGSPEPIDGDSSGESDDTVIEDTVADPTVRGEEGAQNSVQPQKPTSAPTTSVKKENVTIDSKDRSGEPLKSAQEARIPRKTPEGSWGFIDDFETVQTKADVLGGSPVGAPQFPKQFNTSLPVKERQDTGGCEQGFFGDQPGMENISPRGPPASKRVKDAARSDDPNGESFMDFMKECLKSKGNESPEDPVETFSEAELKAARSEVLAPPFQQPLKAAQDFEQEDLTIKALKEAGRKVEAEKPSKFPPPGGRQPGRYGERSPEPLVPAQKSALEKRPLCLTQATDVKLSSASASFGMHDVPRASSRAPPLDLPIPHAIMKLLAEVSDNA